METFKIENERINLSFNTQECVDKLLECYKACGSCLQYSISIGGKYVRQEHISCLIECEEICRTSADFLMSDSVFAQELCGLAARICDACADACLDVDYTDIFMQECAETCRTCAEACRSLEL